ncbi:hypothetical protein FHN55_03390 [Streptomyces sp. NP160]|uniref:hypothetical protein n=1 Tax=Streptomyces sp. NP160 TaxID=2586637 RepID=UPI001119EC7C|nr:hypothetical protein [Streptomyces sp. NP160]TNM69374.1 hypothetical protein FHN55_03390 [Streptomyces sp. NP160]
MTAVAPGGDSGPVRVAVSTAASAQAASDGAPSSTSSAPVAVAKPERSSKGSSPQNQAGGDPGDRNATGAYLASLLAASITGRAPEGPRPSKITPERLSVLISYLEATVSSTRPAAAAHEEHAVDVKS